MQKITNPAAVDLITLLVSEHYWVSLDSNGLIVVEANGITDCQVKIIARERMSMKYYAEFFVKGKPTYVNSMPDVHKTLEEINDFFHGL